MRRRLFSVLAVVGLLAAALFGSPTSPASAAGPTVEILVPFAGTWANESPEEHQLWGQGEWGLDYFGNNQSVKLTVQGAENISLSVVGSWTGCAGSGRRVQIKSGQTVLGTIEFAHLKDPASSVSNGGSLGTTYQWAQCSAWQVTNPGGVHTHIEVAAASGQTSCWVNHGLSAPLDSTAVLARLGSTSANSDGSCAGGSSTNNGYYSYSGKVVKGSGPDLYYIDGRGAKHYVPSGQTGCADISPVSNYTPISDADLNAKPAASNFACDYTKYLGRMVKLSGGSSVYYVSAGGQKRYVGSPSVMDCIGGDVVEVSQAKWDSFPTNSTGMVCGDHFAARRIVAPNGSVYHVDQQGKRHPIGHMDVVNYCFGGDLTNVDQVTIDGIVDAGTAAHCATAMPNTLVQENGNYTLFSATARYPIYSGYVLNDCFNAGAAKSVTATAVNSVPYSGMAASCAMGLPNRMVRVGGGFYFLSAANLNYQIASMDVVTCMGGVGAAKTISAQALNTVPVASSYANCSMAG